MANAVPYVKMNGLGNDFVVIDARPRPLALNDDQVRWMADREQGVGCDQIIIIEPARREGADVFMRIYNAEGGEVDACGNATRCVAALIADETGTNHVVIETNAGLLPADVAGETVTVDMGAPKFGWADIPLEEEFHDTTGIQLQIGPIDAPVLHTPSVVNVGNPHAVFWVPDDPDGHPLERFGPLLENHPIFPERANISIAQVTGRDHIKARVWERGAGLTRACGTAAVAVGVCAMRKGLVDSEVTVELPGGPLQIAWRDRDGHALMTGGWALDGRGALPADLFAEDAAQ